MHIKYRSSQKPEKKVVIVVSRLLSRTSPTHSVFQQQKQNKPKRKFFKHLRKPPSFDTYLLRRSDSTTSCDSNISTSNNILNGSGEFLPYTKNPRASFGNSRRDSSSSLSSFSSISSSSSNFLKFSSILETSSTHTDEYDDDCDSCAENSEEEEFLFMSAFDSSQTEYRSSHSSY
ncbi:8139_t:CDS:2 [Ambispora gerdemannii]|uniref:8139_t:CDS:1 n=1 Tax=Ambispora gerdemannii TaxID=144530 RepID=A0A9N9CQN3_9GLOM|nr:8139_t:CDS:2 [Ambispora gerdemannii]